MTLKIPPEYTDYDFLKVSQREGQAAVRLRFLGLHHIQQGASGKSVGSMLCVCRQTVSQWVGRLCEEGPEGLRDRPRSGATPHLSRDAEKTFKARVVELQEQKEGGRIRAQEMQTLLLEEFNASYTQSGVYELCKRVRLSWVTGRSIHPEASLEEQESFKKTFKKP